MAARGETQANVEVSTLVVPAWRLRWRAPELALVLGERALALASARHDEADRLRAEALVVFAGNRVGRGVRIADRAIDALKAAEAAGEHETAWLLRVELAACARSVGAPLTGFAAVTPVLEAPDVPAELRASALVQASECLVTVGRGDEPTRALAEADQLYVADDSLDDDTRLLLRGLIRAVQAAQHRRWGDIAAAIGAAREGLDLLGRFADPSADSGQGMGRLTLELALALMDANRLLDASEVGTPMLDRPVRAPSASTSGWLRLALATRVHLPAGRVALAREMLRDAAASAERHQLDTLLAESLLALAHVHEVSGDLADALMNLRAAHAAERRRARAVYAVRARLAAEFSGVHRQPADLHQQLADLLRPVEGMQMVTDGMLSAALKQQLRQWRPVQVRKGENLKVKRARRAAEDMTVEGLSAARQHAADRWRMVQPFGEPDYKTPDPMEPPAPTSSDRTVPASGLIASAGAMVSGRRRAARVAAGEIEDDQPTTPAEPPAPTPAASEPQAPQLSPEQERKRKVEQQLMELQREARRQIEAERQARAEQRAKAEREAQAAEEAARQAAEREEAARQAAAREEAARQEAAREAAEREEASRQEAARQAAAREEAARAEATTRAEASRSQPESVLDMLKAQGLRAGGRRRARDTDAESAPAPETPSWRVEPPSRLRQDDQSQQPGQNFFGTPSSPDTTRPEPPLSQDFFTAGRSSGGRSDGPDDFASPASSEAGRADSPLSQDFFTAGRSSGGRSDGPDDFASPASSEAGRADSPLSQDFFASSRSAADRTDSPDYFAEPTSTSTSTDAARADSSASQDYFADSRPSGDRTDGPDHLTDPSSPDTPDRPTRSGLAAAFSRPPGTPDSGPHLDDQAPAYPLYTPAAGFPTPQSDPDERKLPDLDFSSLDFSTPKSEQRPTASIPNPDPAENPDPARPTPPEPTPDPRPEPEPKRLPPIPDPVPSVPVPDEIPQPQEPDLLSSTFLSSADVEDDPADLPTGPVRVQLPSERSARPESAHTDFGTQSAYNANPDTATPTSPAHADQPNQATSAASQSSFGAQPDFALPGGSTDEPSDATYDFFATQPESPQSGSAPRSDVAEPSTPVQSDLDRTADVSDLAQSGTDQPSDTTGKTGSEGRPGRPSSRRKPSDLSLADLLAEALVAYETGRRSDEEQLGDSDLAAPDWSATEAKAEQEQPYRQEQPAENLPASEPHFRFGASEPSGAEPLFLPEQPTDLRQPSAEPLATDPASGTESFYRDSLSFGSQEPAADYLRSGQSFGSQQPAGEPAADSFFQPGLSFGDPAPSAEAVSEARSAGSDSFYLPEQPASETQFSPEQPSAGSAHEARPSAESAEEKTGPIVPVGAAPDSETTGPIRPVQSDGPGGGPGSPGGWTLPGN